MDHIGDSITEQLSKGTTERSLSIEEKDNSQTEEDSVIFIMVFILTC